MTRDDVTRCVCHEEAEFTEIYPTVFSANTSSFSSMEGQEAFKRIANQLRNASSGGGPRGFFAGGGLIIALVAGGVALNASLFNGARSLRRNLAGLKFIKIQWTEVTVQLNIRGMIYLVCLPFLPPTILQSPWRERRGVQRRNTSYGVF